jgi:TPR repeat protein
MAIGWLLFVSTAAAEQRVALVIGNGAYATSKLANPKADADAMARTLTGLGFEVIKRTDADMGSMRTAFTEFARRLRRLESVGLFYYAGHAVQVAGQNYLIPIGADIAGEADIPLQAINLNELLGAMKSGAARVKVAILDACRNNPYEASARSQTRGLALVSAPVGTLIAYATAPGEVALDGASGNSPFTAALTRNMQIRGLVIEEVFKRTREDVLAATQNAQTPWEHSSLIGDFIFRPKAASQEPSNRPVALDPSAADERRLSEIAAWDQIKLATDTSVFRRHIATFPGGAYEELAHYKIAQLERNVGGWSWLQTSAPVVRGEGEGLFERAVKLEATDTPESLIEAARLYRLAAEQGVVTAMANLGRMFDRGRGVQRSTEEAARWYTAAAEANHAGAQGALGTLNELGAGVPVNLTEALRLYRLSAEKGDVHGMTSLAYLYAQGKGVARDFVEARRWYDAAAEKGSVRAMFNLALMQLRGEGGAIDGEAAIKWLNQSVDKGHSGAMRELAYLHDEGRFVVRDSARAAEYFLAALAALKVEAKAGGAASARAAADAMVRKDYWSYATRRAMQKQLIARGQLQGPPTGLFGANTRRALLALAAAD